VKSLKSQLLPLLGDQVEILLNLAWAALAVSMVGLWLRVGDRKDIDRHRQIVAIVILIAILFPVISVSDDLMAMQNATEQNGTERRDLLLSAGDHSIQSLAAVVSALILDNGVRTVRFVSARSFSQRRVERPELSSVENRPPPAA
jgi:hypothetical protein